MPADPRRAVLLRRIEAVDGPAKVTVFLDVRGGYGRSRATSVERHGGIWTGRSGTTRFRWSGAAKARPVDGGLRMTIELAEGATHELVLEISDRDLPDEPAGRRPHLGGDGRGLVAGRARLQRPDRRGGRAARVRRAARPDLRERRDGGGGHHVAARAAGRRPQLRLPVRVDQGPVLRRPRRRRARAASAAHRRGAVRHRAAARRRARPDARVHGQRAADPRRAAAPGAARLPWRDRAGGELGVRAVPAGRAGRVAVAAGRRGGARHARRGGLAGGVGRRRGDRETVGGTGRGHLGAGRPALGALPAGLRVRAARDRGRGRRRADGRARAAGGGAVERAGRRDRRPASATACTRPGGGSGRRTTSGWTPRCSFP